MQRRMIPLPGVHPAKETSQNASALFVCIKSKKESKKARIARLSGSLPADINY